MQERQRFYNGSVRQRKAPRFTGEGRRYVVQTFVHESDLTTKQVNIDPSTGVSDNRTSLRLHVNMVPARRARHR